jgi:hypothetical protein
MKIEIPQFAWQTIYHIPQGNVLIKGQGNELSRNILKAAETILAQYGCYGWFADETLVYVGSFSPYQSEASSLRGRLKNYLGNHDGSTNKMVFDKANEALVHHVVTIAYFTFEALYLDEQPIAFAEFSHQGHFVRVVEELLICIYRRQDMCNWNRT